MNREELAIIYNEGPSRARTESVSNETGVAIADIGLGGKAIMGKKWPKHSANIVEQFKGMLNYDGVCGLCLCEVGSWDEPFEIPEGEIQAALTRRSHLVFVTTHANVRFS